MARKWSGYLSAHQTWVNMLARCLKPDNPAYPNYGGHGIKVCDRWLKFEYFLLDMGPCPKRGLTLDRIDNDEGYKKLNCHWASRKQQANNRRIPDRSHLRGVKHPWSKAAKKRYAKLRAETEVSNDTRDKLSAASSEMWANRSEAERHKIGKKITKAQKGRPKSDEHVQALKEAWTETRRKKMSKHFKGRVFSEETRKKMRLAAKRRWTKEKESA